MCQRTIQPQEYVPDVRMSGVDFASTRFLIQWKSSPYVHFIHGIGGRRLRSHGRRGFRENRRKQRGGVCEG